jgi:uncharacterized membrane protein YbhN (UPF0104 family)
MKKLLALVGSTLGSSLGWWLGTGGGFMAAFLLSVVGGGLGIYAGFRAADRLVS